MGAGGGWGGIVDLAVEPRPAQRRLLELAAIPEAAGDDRLHLAAPPGTGKTLVALELARLRGRGTLVLVPNTHLVEQWKREFLTRFASGSEGMDLEEVISTDPRQPSTITVTTYQSLSVPAREGGALDALAHEAWVRELGGVGDLGVEDLERMMVEDPVGYRRLLRERVRNLRRSLTRKGAMQVTPLLHTNSRLALAALEAAKVRTVILDECHHLLDHWALVVIELVERLRASDQRRTQVIGVTATLPAPSARHQRDRYDDLLGPVDVEIPVPAVVVEGGLAPFRETTVEVGLTEPEQRIVADLGGAFRLAATDVTASEGFRTWLVGTLVDATATPDAYASWLVEEPEFSGAVLRAHRHWTIALPGSLPIPADAFEPFEDDDLIRLLGRHHREVLALATDPEAKALRTELSRVCAAFGLQLTAKGPRQGRSPIDQLLTRSDAKGTAAAAILEAEHASRGADVRALVAVDFDVAPSPHALLRGVLDRDAGSARRLHGQLVRDARAGKLDPVLVTGRTLRAGNVIADELATAVNMHLHAAGIDARCEATPVDDRVQELVGRGPGWSSRHVLPAVTAALEDGITRCLVATRGLVGQGWDCPSLNVLIDLTQSAGPVAAPQLHGRTLRLDPSDPDKVAHNWTVVAVSDDLPGGQVDRKRHRRRNDHLWSIALDDPPSVGRGGAVEAIADATAITAVAGDRGGVLAAWSAVTTPEIGEVVSEVAVDHPAAEHGDGRPWNLRGPTGWIPPFAGVTIGAAAAVGTAGLGVPELAVAGAGVGSGGLTWLGGTMAHREEPRRLLKRVPLAGTHEIVTDRLDVKRFGRLVIFLAQATRDGLVAAELVPERARTSGVRLQRRDGRVVIRFTDPQGPALTTAAHDLLTTAVTEVLRGGVGLREARYALVVSLRPGRRSLPCPAVAGTTNTLATAFAEAFGASLHLETEPAFLRSPTGRQVLLDAMVDAPVPFAAASRHVWA